MSVKLAFSGGGFRAAFYALGAYRRLVELGMQGVVSHISSVSGGSLTAGAILHGLRQGEFGSVEDFDEKVTGPLRRFGQLNLRRKLLVEAIRPRLRNFRLEWIKNRLSRLLQEVLDQELFHHALLPDLPAFPEWSCNATCLNTMKRFRFKVSDMYGKSLGLCSDLHDIKVSLAVAASNAFPLLFAPVRLPNRGRQYHYHDGTPVPGQPPAMLYLTDGGVYDNLGSENLLKEELPFIVMDASLDAVPGEHLYRPRVLGLGWRLQELYFQQIIDLRRRMLARHCQGVQLPISRSLQALLGEEIKTERPFPEYHVAWNELEQLVAGLRTDLDAFHDIEIDALMWAGAIRMDAAIKALEPDLVPAGKWEDVPAFPHHPETRMREVLTKGRGRGLLRLHKQLQ